MELSFGCRVRTSKYGFRALETLTMNYVDDEKWGMCGREGRVNRKEIIEIIGHPITLEHCRMALRRYEEIPDRAQCLRIDEANLCQKWIPLQSWESQTEVHEFLKQYLL